MNRLSFIIPCVAFGLTPASAPAQAPAGAIPAPVTATNFQDLLERPPFRRYLSLSDALVLSGVATLPGGKLVTVWNRATGESFVVTVTPNAQGWKLAELTESSDLRRVTAIIEAGTQQITLRFDPDRLIPPKLDNRSKPGARSESDVVIEALLRSLDPASARQFEGLPAKPQETFRKAFAEFLDTYPTATDARRLAFVQHALEEAQRTEGDGAPTSAPSTSTAPEAPPPATTDDASE